MTKIRVTDWHIKTGCVGSRRFCAVANAITARLPAFQRAEVDQTAVEILDAANQTLRVVTLPQEAQAFIWNADAGHRVYPFEFDLM